MQRSTCKRWVASVHEFDSAENGSDLQLSYISLLSSWNSTIPTASSAILWTPSNSISSLWSILMDTCSHLLRKNLTYILRYAWTTNRLWRKNRRNNGGGVYGVDLNRNWNDHWWHSIICLPNCFEGVEQDLLGMRSDFVQEPNCHLSVPSSDTYRGTAAFSEPESAAVSDYISSLPNILAGTVTMHWHFSRLHKVLIFIATRSWCSVHSAGPSNGSVYSAMSHSSQRQLSWWGGPLDIGRWHIVHHCRDLWNPIRVHQIDCAVRHHRICIRLVTPLHHVPLLTPLLGFTQKASGEHTLLSWEILAR